METKLLDYFIQEINGDSELSDDQKKKILKGVFRLKQQKVNLLIVGPTGCGKSSTINALFGVTVAKVGNLDPETMGISRYDLDNLILWDSPGLGDSPEQDRKHCQKIIAKLHESDSKGQALIDLVMVIVDGSTRDMGTVYDLINNTIIPNLQDGENILVAINQCDMALKGDGWDSRKLLPDSTLLKFLDSKVESVKRRVLEATGKEIEPIFYSAKYKYNISKLLAYVLRNTRDEKRIVIAQNMNKDKKVYTRDDGRSDYKGEIKDTIGKCLKYAAAGAAIGEKIGSPFGPVGKAIGTGIGAVVGFIGGLFS